MVTRHEMAHISQIRNLTVLLPETQRPRSAAAGGSRGNGIPSLAEDPGLSRPYTGNGSAGEVRRFAPETQVRALGGSLSAVLDGGHLARQLPQDTELGFTIQGLKSRHRGVWNDAGRRSILYSRHRTHGVRRDGDRRLTDVRGPHTPRGARRRAA